MGAKPDIKRLQCQALEAFEYAYEIQFKNMFQSYQVQKQTLNDYDLKQWKPFSIPMRLDFKTYLNLLRRNN